MTALLTEFASPDRAAPGVVAAQSRHFTDGPLFLRLLDYVPDMIMVLNSQRQIVYANRAVLDFVSATDLSSVMGSRPGEMLHCKHSTESAAGCGTTRFCSQCGAVNATLQTHAGQFAVEECRMIVETAQGEEALDLRVWASPVEVGGERFTFFVIASIADEKRRLWLENIFLHDLMNSATALQGFVWLLAHGGGEAQGPHDFVETISALSARIIEEIESHRQLVAAENNTLEIQLTSVDSRAILDDVFAAYNNADRLNGRVLCIDPGAETTHLHTDRSLLLRVVGNMTKNALEGSVPGEVVTLGCHREPDAVSFWVHNPTYIPENVRLQIFNRSFSTKGRGRGLGTYSMKFLTERYLGGHVSFTSTEAGGTTFTATYPLVLKAAEPARA